MTYQAVLVRLLAAIVSCGASATALGATAKFECDTASSRYSTVSLPVAGQHIRVSGAVSSELTRQGSDWFPKLSLLVGDPEQQFAGFTISDESGQSWDVALVHSVGESTSVATLARLSPTAFALDVNASAGTIDLTLGANHYHGAGPRFQPQQLTLACSTGEFLFDQLSWEVLPN